ncbi:MULTISPECIES: SF1B family DNA helicase RecD2 [Pseudomonas]|uniref:SF1B family DNA helicase RecD2 n=1 Tax=Pseudomonas TaxID=286 RepID=UPI000F0207D5|nr:MULTISPECIES: ATP-dependent RecD-like DNA helicase [Pseudomonas]MBD8614842.1 ATP-dependent RecD-like DNA helicase [Pseudomonas putida]MBD8681474.1 ATP-dependent RecD-like DNA helicase [Pseudomonas sp. CFBP 13719]
MEILTGVIRNVIHNKGDGFIIFRLDNSSGGGVVLGDDVGLYEGDLVTCEGRWEDRKPSPNANRFDPNFDKRQFRAKSIVPDIPTTIDAILAYIAAGRVKGVSIKLATRLVKTFGLDTLNIIENHPERLKQVPGFGPAKIEALVEGLKNDLGMRAVHLFLHSFGLGRRHIKLIVDALGISAVEQIKANPYQLYFLVKGVGFKMVDSIAEQVGVEADDPYRVMIALLTGMDQGVNGSGDTCFTERSLCMQAWKLLSKTSRPLGEDAILPAVELLKGSNLVKTDMIDGELYIFPKELFYAEKQIVKDLYRLHTGIGQFLAVDSIRQGIEYAEQNLGITLSPMQREAVTTTLSNPLSIITGGPGTGKTTIMRVLLLASEVLFRQKPDATLLCAPTGKASKRLSQSAKMTAMTLHKALVFSPDDGGFQFNEDNKLPQSLIVIDEASMVDTQLAAAFFQSVRTGARVVVVGDYDQIPSVGAGKVLRDMIESEQIPTTRLDKIFRQAEKSLIKSNAHLIRTGQMIRRPEKGEESDFWFIPSPSSTDIATKIEGLMARLSKHYGYDPFEDIQVLTPMRKGEAGVYALNRRLQKLLNPNVGTGLRCHQDGEEIEYCVGDKVMHIKNNNTLQVMNGETGRVVLVDIKDRKVTVEYEGRRVVYEFLMLEELRLAYAYTVHKSQGSEYPCIIMVVSTDHFHMLNRNLYYTGLTRGKATALMVGQIRAVEIALTKEATELRRTALNYYLREIWARQGRNRVAA